MGLLSNCCHIFRRLGARAGRVAAGVPGCGGGAEGPFSKQTSCVPAHPEGGQKSHRAEGRQWSGGLGLQWVTELSPQNTITVIKMMFAYCSECREGKGIIVHHLVVGEVVSSPHECRLSPFISPNNCSLTLLICIELVLQEDTSLHSLLMTILSLCTGMNCNYG